jgi:proline racemase
VQPSSPRLRTGVTNVITAVDAHAGGEPGRVIVGGVPDVPGQTMFDKKMHLERFGDDLRKRMLSEPRGYPALCCNLILPSSHPEAAAGYVIMEATEYPPMSGSNTICVATVLIETGMVPVREPVTELVLESPAGLIRIRAEVAGGKARRITFENVPSFAVHLDAAVEVPGLGTVTVDIAYGGMFFAITEAGALGLSLTPDNGRELVRVGEMIKAAAKEQLPVVHPDNDRIAGVTMTMFSGPPSLEGATLKNTCVMSTGAFDWEDRNSWTGILDRSPCGTGTSAKMAVLHARGRLGLGEVFDHESIISSVFSGRLLRETKVGPYRAVVPEVSGEAWITGIGQYVLDPEDPFPEGFTVSDIWGGKAGRLSDPLL